MTNLPSRLKRAVPVLALLLIALLLIALPRLNALFFAHMHYEKCSDLVQQDPAKGLALARQWRAGSPESPMAQHCEALGLFATKDYMHAGDAFAALAKKASPTNPALAARLFAQGARAYEAAEKYDMAKEAVTAALLLRPDDKETSDLASEINKKTTPEPPSGAPAAPAPSAR